MDDTLFDDVNVDDVTDDDVADAAGVVSGCLRVS